MQSNDRWRKRGVGSGGLKKREETDGTRATSNYSPDHHLIEITTICVYLEGSLNIRYKLYLSLSNILNMMFLDLHCSIEIEPDCLNTRSIRHAIEYRPSMINSTKLSPTRHFQAINPEPTDSSLRLEVLYSTIMISFEDSSVLDQS